MIPSLSQETLTQYASDAQTIQEPTGTDYSKGVSAGRTIPAKWWNWLFSAVTKRAGQSKTDAQNMLTELKNVVTDAGITPDAEDDTQLSQAIAAKADTQIDAYVASKRSWGQYWNILEKIKYKGNEVEVLQHYKEPEVYINDTYGAVLVADMTLQGVYEQGWFYSVDGENWYRFGGLTSNVYAYDLCFVVGNMVYGVAASGVGGSSAGGSISIYSSPLFSDEEPQRIYWETDSSLVSPMYPVLTIVLNDTLFLMNYKGALLKFTDTSGSYVTIAAPTGLGQKSLVNNENLEAHYCNVVAAGDSYFIGNIKVSADMATWETMYTASSADSNAYNVYVKTLSSGAVAICDADYNSGIDIWVVTPEQSVIHIDDAQYRAANGDKNTDSYLVLRAPVTPGHSTTDKANTITYDGVNFIPLYRRILYQGALRDEYLSVLGEIDGVTYFVSADGSYSGNNRFLYRKQGPITADLDGLELVTTFYGQHVNGWVIPFSTNLALTYQDPDTLKYVYSILNVILKPNLPLLTDFDGAQKPMFWSSYTKHTNKQHDGTIGEKLFMGGKYGSGSTQYYLIYSVKEANYVAQHTLFLH